MFVSTKMTYVAKQNIYPLVSKSLDKNTQKYKRNIQKFIEVRSKELYDIAPFTRLYFGANDINDFFKAIEISKNDIRDQLTKTYYWNMNFNPAAAKDEFTMTMMMVIRYFIMKKDQKNAELSSIYLAFSGKFYPSLHYKYFKVVQPSEYRHVMEYVVNNMLTQKFDLKREGNLFGAIRSLCITWLNTYENIFKDPSDEDVADLIQQLHGRINSFMKNISKLYYEAYQNKDQYISYDSDELEGDDFRLTDNDSLKAERFVENTMIYINTHAVDITLCRMASDSNVKVAEVKSIIESIQSDNANIPDIKELLRITISEYLSTTKDKSVTNYSFVAKSIAPKPNTKNKNIIRQKQIIENWLDENSPQYRKRKSRAATKSSYFKSVLTYYVLLANKANK